MLKFSRSGKWLFFVTVIVVTLCMIFQWPRENFGFKQDYARLARVNLEISGRLERLAREKGLANTFSFADARHALLDNGIENPFVDQSDVLYEVDEGAKIIRVVVAEANGGAYGPPHYDPSTREFVFTLDFSKCGRWIDVYSMKYASVSISWKRYAGIE